MRKALYAAVLVMLSMTWFSAGSSAQDAAEIMKTSHLAYYYAGDDGLSQVTMTLVDKKGKERNREFVMLRLDIEEGGKQNYYTYFKKPSDVSRMTFMVHKTPDGNDRRWIYVPAVDLVKPISADDKNSSFVGSDFTYEDVSGRHWSEDNHSLLEDSQVGDKPVFVVESIPKTAYKGFAKKVTYIDKTSYLPLKEEYFDKKGVLVREFIAESIEEIDGIPTITTRVMKNIKKKSHTVVAFSSISYDVGIDESLFTERYLKNPPRKYIK